MNTAKVFLVFVTAIFFAGCSAYDRSAPLPKTFLEEVDLEKQLPNLPFEHSWVWVEEDLPQYQAVFVKPVRTDLLPAKGWEKSISVALATQAEFNARAAEIAIYFREKLQEELKKLPEPRYQLAEQPGKGVLVVEIVLTELELSHPLIRAGSLAVPIPGTAQAISTVTNPHAAFALRVTDGESGKLIATIADRKFPPARLMDFNKVTVTSSVREVCANWVVELVELLQKGYLAEVPTRGVFRLLPW